MKQSRPVFVKNQKPKNLIQCLVIRDGHVFSALSRYVVGDKLTWDVFAMSPSSLLSEINVSALPTDLWRPFDGVLQELTGRKS